MANTLNRLSAKKVEDIYEVLQMSNLRTLFYDKYGPVRDRLLSRAQIIETLDIPVEKMNRLELRGLDSMLGTSLHHLKTFSQNRKYNWIEIRVTDTEEGKAHIYYGFTSQIAEIDSNEERFEAFKNQWQRVHKTTKQLASMQRKEIEAA